MSLATTRLSIQLVVVFVVVVVSKRSPLLLLLLLLLPVSVVAEVVEAVVVGWQLEFASQEQPSGQIYGPQKTRGSCNFQVRFCLCVWGKRVFPSSSSHLNYFSLLSCRLSTSSSRDHQFLCLTTEVATFSRVHCVVVVVCKLLLAFWLPLVLPAKLLNQKGPHQSIPLNCFILLANSIQIHSNHKQ